MRYPMFSNVAMSLAAALPMVGLAVQLQFDSGFAGACAEDGLPANWEFHTYGGYMPKADVEVVEDAALGKVLHYHNARGKSGSGIYTVGRVKGRSGDIVNMSLKARGSGKAFACLYCWKDNGRTFVRTLMEKSVSLAPEWKTFEFQFTLEDHVDAQTGSFAMAIGINPGADAYFADVRSCRDLETVETLSMDDFEKPAQRAGAPEIISANIAPGLLVDTKQGVYRTDGVLSVDPPATYEVPPNTGSRYLSFGARIYGFGGKGASAKFVTSLGMGTNSVTATVASAVGTKDIVLSIEENGRKIAAWPVPRAALPADFSFSAGADGTADFAVTSLADSSHRNYTTHAASLVGASGELRTSRLFVSEGGVAEMTVDNLSLSISEMKRVAEVDYPYVAEPEPSFDPVSAGWPLVFSDEFDGTVVDTNKWNLTGEKWKREYASLSGDGRLLIKADVRPGTDALGTAVLRSRESFLHGYFEARVKFTRQRGWWAAFWLCSYGIDNPFANGMEIDIFEDYYTRARPGAECGKTLDHNLHVKGTDVLKSFNYNSTLPGSLDEFYVIGCKWTPYEISYYLNGKLIQSKATHSPYKSVTFDAFRHGTTVMPLHAIVSGQIMNKGWGAVADRAEAKFPELYEVDYVRIYGLPGDADGMSPGVAMSGLRGDCVVEKFGTELKFRVDVRPAAKTLSPIRAVHLFDSGYYLGTCRSAPYDFVVPFTEKWFSKTAWMQPGRSKVQPKFADGIHAFSAFAEDEAGNVGFSRPKFVIPAPPKVSTPYGGKAQAIPGTVVVGRYDEGGEGVAYHDTTKGNVTSKTWRADENVDCKEHNIGTLSSGEWLRFTVDVKKDGDYRIVFNYGTPSPARHMVVFLCDGVEVGRIDLPTHEFEDWRISTKKSVVVRLPAGRHALTVLTLGLFNYGDMAFQAL